MVQRSRMTEEIRERALERILETRIAGKDTRHSRATNLHAIQELVKGHPHYTFGIKGVERFTPQQVLEAIADITKCSKDPSYTEGGGYISPQSTLKGLEMGARAISAVAKHGGRFIVATGHPGALLLFYIELGRLIRKWGGEIIVVERGAFVPPNFDLDYVEDVAVISDRCSVWHSHDIVPMEIILKAAGPVDFVVADHGFAGGAVNAGIPVMAIIDTNDPALAVAKRMGADVIVVPMDDNRPLSAYFAAVEIIRDFVEFEDTQLAADGGELARDIKGLHQVKSKPNLRPEVTKAEELVRQRLGPPEALDQMVEAFLDGFRDQFVQTRFDIDKEDHLINDPHVILSIYGQVLASMERFVAHQIGVQELDLTKEEIEFYLGRRSER